MTRDQAKKIALPIVQSWRPDWYEREYGIRVSRHPIWWVKPLMMVLGTAMFATSAVLISDGKTSSLVLAAGAALIYLRGWFDPSSTTPR